MSHSYAALYYHFVWATRQREAVIVPDMERILYPFIRTSCHELGGVVYALNGLEDHVHLVCSVPRRVSISAFMEKIKGSSSHYINRQENQLQHLYWQPGYGVLTFAAKDLSGVVAYVKNQKTRHAKDALWSTLERLGAAPFSES